MPRERTILKDGLTVPPCCVDEEGDASCGTKSLKLTIRMVAGLDGGCSSRGCLANRPIRPTVDRERAATGWHGTGALSLPGGRRQGGLTGRAGGCPGGDAPQHAIAVVGRPAGPLDARDREPARRPSDHSGDLPRPRRAGARGRRRRQPLDLRGAQGRGDRAPHCWEGASGSRPRPRPHGSGLASPWGVAHRDRLTSCGPGCARAGEPPPIGAGIATAAAARFSWNVRLPTGSTSP